jgi:hypothetical protein
MGSVAVAVVAAAITIHEAPGLDLERARVHQLIDEAVVRVEADEPIVMDPAARIELALKPRGGPIHIIPGPLPTEPDLVNRYASAVLQAGGEGPIWLAVGHHNPTVEADLAPLLRWMGQLGRVEKVWSDYHVALYRYEPGRRAIAQGEPDLAR